MNKKDIDDIIKTSAENRKNYARECVERISKENGRIAEADYMLQRFLDILNTEVEPQESEEQG